LAGPVAPVLQGALQAQRGASFLESRIIDATEQEFGTLALIEGEFGDCRIVLDTQHLV